MTNYQALIAARSKATIAKFLNDPVMRKEALRSYFYAIGGRAKHH
ncbi:MULTISPECIES: hypothetical protein [unclassified Pantoea]|nr:MULTISPECIES: hypothetical protein [unclassified Pantoea]MDU5473986.1 hypothetical protein [Pantoea sp.]DAI70412.1 MAG TPA: Kil protein [Bacteriophage sp.]